MHLFRIIHVFKDCALVKKPGYLLLLSLQFFSCVAISQKQNLHFSHLTTLDGLSQSNVLCVLQDSRGFMWFGTEDGLNKYDGYHFTVYTNDPQKNNTISNNNITDIVEDNDGDLWIATFEGGLNRYDRQKDEFIRYKYDAKNPNSISNDFTTCLLKDSKENIWTGTSEGLSIFDKKNNRFTRYSTNGNSNKGISNNRITVIYEDSDHDIWIGTAEGLDLFNPGQKSFTHFLHNDNDPGSLSSNSITSILEDSKHRLWIGTNGGGLNLLDKQTGKFRIFREKNIKAPAISENIIFSMTEDDEGKIWIASENNGISLFNPATEIFTNYSYNDFDDAGLNSNSINRIYKDKKGNIWIGTYNAGINLLNPDASKFTHYTHTSSLNSLSNNKILKISRDAKDNLWIATDGDGIDLYDRHTGNFKHFRHEAGNNNTIAGNNVLSVLEDSYQNVWVGTYLNGVTVINRNKNTYRHFKNDPANPHSLASNSGWVLYEDREKNIWIGSENGLSLYDRDKNCFIQYKAGTNQLSNNNITAIQEDSDGFIWIGTGGGGINRLDKKANKIDQFYHDDNKNSLGNNSVNSFCEDKNGNLWIGTNHGLNCLNRKTHYFTSYGMKDGLPHEKIAGILEDDKENLWISTGKGLSKFNPVNKTFINFGVAEGLQGNEFKLAYCKTRSGVMYFGGNNGFNEFYPDSIKDSPFDPPLVITDFRIFNKSVPISNDKNDPSPLIKSITETKEIILSYQSSVITFEFASLNYTSGEKKQYAYMLEGFDVEWNNIGTERTATYTNLDPGKYTFRVKGLNNEGQWSANIPAIKLTITPPFWLTSWFRMTMIVFLSSVIIIFYLARTNAIKRQRKNLEQKVKEQTIQLIHSGEELEKKNKELEQFVYIASHDLREPLRTTSGFVELFQKQYKGKLDEKADMYLGHITQGSDRMRRLIDDLLDYSRINGKKEMERVDCNAILQEVLSDLGKVISESGAKIRATHLPVINGHPTSIKQLFQNLIANGIKFKKKGTTPEIQIASERSNDSWKFSFKDNGIGIEQKHNEKIFAIFERLHSRKEYEGSGIGLAHCKKIVELHEGNIWVESAAGTGSTFYFTIHKNHIQ